MTAVEWLEKELNEKGKLTPVDFYQAKAMEKQQIIDAAERWKGTDFAEKYYSETYGSDEPAKNFWVDDVKYQELIRPASFQVEISDEEIKEAAKDYHWKNGVYYAQEKTFIDAIKWYREQLKQRAK